MATRSVEGPADDWLDMADLTRLTGLGESTIRRLIDAGEFPVALEPTPGTRLWFWEDVVYWSLRVKLRGRLVPKPTGRKPPPTPTDPHTAPSEQRDDAAD